MTNTPETSSNPATTRSSVRSDAMRELFSAYMHLVAEAPEDFDEGIKEGFSSANSFRPNPIIIEEGGPDGAYDLGLALAQTIRLVPEPIRQALLGDIS